MKVLFSSLLLALASLVPAQLFPCNEGGNLEEFARIPEYYDGLMVATVLDGPVGRPLPGDPNLAVQRMRVLDSRAFAPGAVVDVYVLTPGGSMTDVHAQRGVPYP